MRYLKQYVKQTLAASLYHSGLLDRLASLRLNQRAIVLMYHRVIPTERLHYCHSGSGIVVHDDTFCRHLEFLKTNFRVLSLEEFIGYFEHGRSFPEKSCLITFDDGWIDNYRTAYPILCEHGVPATIFLPTDFIETGRMFWQEELNIRLTRLCRSDEHGDRDFVKRLLMSAVIPNQEQRQSFIQSLKGLGYPGIQQVLDQVRNQEGGKDLPEHDDRHLSWNDVSEMQANGISFGSHCLSHRILTHLSASEKRDEVAKSKSILQSMLGYDVKTIAYPNGDFDDEVISLAREAGYTLGFSTLPGFVSSDTPAMTVPRFNIHEGAANTEAKLLCRMLGVF